MRIINQVIITTGIQKQMVCQTTIRNKMSQILEKWVQQHCVKHQKVIGMDGKGDKTLTIRNQVVMEEHLTFVDQTGHYLDHADLSNKKSVTQTGKLLDVLDRYKSKETLEILKTDGENANTGPSFIYSCFKNLLFILNSKIKIFLLFYFDPKHFSLTQN